MTQNLRPRDWITAAFSVLLLILAPLSAVSESSVELSFEPLPIADDVAGMRIETDTVKLSLEEAIAFALQRNLSLNVQRYEVAKSREGITANRGIFDFNTQAVSGAYSETSPSATNLDGALVQKQDGQSLDFTLSQLTSWGGTGSFVWTTVGAMSTLFLRL